MLQSKETVDIAELLENQGITWFRVRVIAWACVLMTIEGYNMLVLGYATPSIIKVWHINKAHFASVFSSGLAGYMVGATLLTHLADKFGRKRLIIAGVLFFGMLTLATAYATSLSELVVIRLIAGIGLGASIPTTIALAAEYVPSRTRATTIGAMFVGYNLGGALGGLIAARFVPRFGWPIIFLVGGITPIVLAAFLIFALPESVRFLTLKQRRPDTVAAILGKLLPKRTFAPDARFVLREENQGGLPVRHLFTEGRGLVTSLLWLAFVSSLLGHYFLTSWLPTVLEGNGVSFAHAVIAGALFQAGGAIGSVLVCWYLDKLGIVAIAVAFGIASVLTVLIGFAGASDALMMPVVFLNGICMLGGQVGLNAVSGTIYPTYIRSTGAGWAFGVGRIGSILGPVIGGLLTLLCLPCFARLQPICWDEHRRLRSSMKQELPLSAADPSARCQT